MTEKEKSKTELMVRLGRVLNESDLFARDKVECLHWLGDLIRDGLCEYGACEAAATTRDFFAPTMTYALNVCDTHRKELEDGPDGDDLEHR